MPITSESCYLKPLHQVLTGVWQMASWCSVALRHIAAILFMIDVFRLHCVWALDRACLCAKAAIESHLVHA